MMMKTLQLAVLAALVILAASTYIRPWRRSCPNKGQFFSLCAPPAPDCVPTCENPNAACRAPCVPGCKCPYGRVLDTENGRCVPKDHCPQVLCSLEPEVGFCRGYFPRYFHNSTSKQCEKFIYGGCGGNANKFRTLSQCQQTCNVCPVEGQVYSNCARACTFTCDNVNRLVCITLCTAGCDCPGGQVIDTELNKCVPIEECPARRSCRLANGTKIKDGERYQPDPCTFCECDNGNLVCAVIDCVFPPCDDFFVPPGECCPVCPPTLPPKCAAVLCPFVNCSGAVIPEGECCAVCPPTLPPKCALVLCLAVDCPGATIPEGECCPVCPPTLPPKCASVQCAAVKCPRPTIPEGQCCPVCPKYKVCEYNGQTYLPGDSFPSTDGCNTCTCSENGLVACTERACLPKLVCPKPTGFGICVELCPVGADCGPGMKCCSNGCGHVCMNATDCALVDCAPTPCNFPGGVVVPAGEDECCPTCGCRRGNETYSVGDSFPAGDGCNRCSCTSRGVRCTLIACKSPELEY